MLPHDAQSQDETLGKTSRRGFLKGAASLAGPALARAYGSKASGAAARSTQGPILAYVGTYSSPETSEGSKSNGEGIYLFEMDPSTGDLTQREVFADGSNPSFLALHPSGTHLYAVNETQTYQGARSGSVSAYSIDRSNGHLTFLNTVSSEGAGPAQMSVHPSGKYALVANYFGGTVAVISIRPDGSLGAATDVKQDKGEVGPPHAASAPPGSFAISGHHSPHPHMIRADPAGRFVLSSDLGMDRIFVWKFDAQKGKLSANNPAFVSLPPGDGPRHFAFHPNRRWMYSLQEEASTVVFFGYDTASGRLTRKQMISNLPEGFTGTNFASEIAVSADGKFVYTANRLHDSISVFSIGKTGMLTFTGEAWTRGDFPRSFGIDPTGNFLCSCNQKADAITAFRIHRETGRLTFTGRYTPVGTPSFIIFLT